ncbi:MAG TPA: pyridoxal-phosphate dependent enzyme [Anaerolineales bacterium]|nr:pyridoxal-phosphate dependent enzyme [Anaerolineales bacterium]
MKFPCLPTLESIESARGRLAGTILRTPLIRFQSEDIAAVIYLKLENLQPTGSFKVRGAGNALLAADPSGLKNGVWTASAGNMGQALAWYARKLKIDCAVVVPDDAPDVKVEAIRGWGAEIIKVPFPEYQSIQKEGAYPALHGLLIHPFADESVMAGNGTIGLEILEDLPEVDTVLVPFGGGGLSCGIAASIKAGKPEAHVEAVEVAVATPLRSSLLAGRPVEVPYRSSFVSGMGAPFVFPQMWPLASRSLDGSQVVELEDVASAIRLLAERHHMIVEGAGAVALAAALKQPAGKEVVCIISGGNINVRQLTEILRGEMP